MFCLRHFKRNFKIHAINRLRLITRENINRNLNTLIRQSLMHKRSINYETTVRYFEHIANNYNFSITTNFRIFCINLNKVQKVIFFRLFFILNPFQFNPGPYHTKAKSTVIQTCIITTRHRITSGKLWLAFGKRITQWNKLPFRFNIVVVTVAIYAFRIDSLKCI